MRAHSLVLLAIGACGPVVDDIEDLQTGTSGLSTDHRVYAIFDLGHPDTGPFPSDAFTTEDPTQNTGRRLNYPYPDCASRPSDCDDLALVNTLDGWGLQPQLVVPFSGDIDPSTITDHTIFVLSLESTLPGDPPGGQLIGINQIIWDPATHSARVEPEELLDQHRRYALLVTRGLQDTDGKAVKATPEFKNLENVPAWYRERLEQALDAAGDRGIDRDNLVSASVFTTQTITSVMERLRDQIKASTPAPADFLLGPAGERSVFARTEVASISWKQQTVVSPPGFVTTPINLAPLQVVPGAVGTIAFGRFVSPQYIIHPGEYIPAVGTLNEVPPVQAIETIYFTLYLPSGPKPANGWPISLIGHGLNATQHFTSDYASKLAANGIATIGFNTGAQGFGPLSTLTITKTDGSSLVTPDRGRSLDQNGDNVLVNGEGQEAAGARAFTVSVRDTYRQNVIDLMALVRVIEVGMDVDGDGTADIDPSRIYFTGQSAGSQFGTMFLALEPSVRVSVCSSVSTALPESSRWQIVRRPIMGLRFQERTPSLINSPGITAIEGVNFGAPYFNENKPLRDQPTLINTVQGAIELQNAMELAEMVSLAGSPLPWIRYIRERPLPGVSAKSIIYQIAKGDQQAPNPGQSALIRAGNLSDRLLYYRHDLAFAQDPTMAKNPHLFASSASSPNAMLRSIARGAQDQIGAFYASDGATVIQPSPTQFFEMPITGPLPEIMNYIP